MSHDTIILLLNQPITEILENQWARELSSWIVWNSIPDSDRALPNYKFKNTLQSRVLDILIQEDTYVGVRALFDIFSKY